MNERNRSTYDEVKIKPITQEEVEVKNYKKGTYLKPFQNQRATATGNDSDFLSTAGDKLGL
jgi:hypothetical protein